MKCCKGSEECYSGAHIFPVRERGSVPKVPGPRSDGSGRGEWIHLFDLNLLKKTLETNPDLSFALAYVLLLYIGPDLIIVRFDVIAMKNPNCCKHTHCRRSSKKYSWTYQPRTGVPQFTGPAQYVIKVSDQGPHPKGPGTSSKSHATRLVRNMETLDTDVVGGKGDWVVSDSDRSDWVLLFQHIIPGNGMWAQLHGLQREKNDTNSGCERYVRDHSFTGFCVLKRSCYGFLYHLMFDLEHLID